MGGRRSRTRCSCPSCILPPRTAVNSISLDTPTMPSNTDANRLTIRRPLPHPLLVVPRPVHILFPPRALFPSGLLGQPTQIFRRRPGPFDPRRSSLIAPCRSFERRLVRRVGDSLVVLRPVGVLVERIGDGSILIQRSVGGESLKVSFSGVFLGFDVFVFCGRWRRQRSWPSVSCTGTKCLRAKCSISTGSTIVRSLSAPSLSQARQGRTRH